MAVGQEVLVILARKQERMRRETVGARVRRLEAFLLELAKAVEKLEVHSLAGEVWVSNKSIKRLRKAVKGLSGTNEQKEAG
jgi:hypothetical protein